jgi:hypothetical protein
MKLSKKMMKMTTTMRTKKSKKVMKMMMSISTSIIIMEVWVVFVLVADLFGLIVSRIFLMVAFSADHRSSGSLEQIVDEDSQSEDDDDDDDYANDDTFDEEHDPDEIGTDDQGEDDNSDDSVDEEDDEDLGAHIGFAPSTTVRFRSDSVAEEGGRTYFPHVAVAASSRSMSGRPTSYSTSDVGGVDSYEDEEDVDDEEADGDANDNEDSLLEDLVDGEEDLEAIGASSHRLRREMHRGRTTPDETLQWQHLANQGIVGVDDAAATIFDDDVGDDNENYFDDSNDIVVDREVEADDDALVNGVIERASPWIRGTERGGGGHRRSNSNAGYIHSHQPRHFAASRSSSGNTTSIGNPRSFVFENGDNNPEDMAIDFVQQLVDRANETIRNGGSFGEIDASADIAETGNRDSMTFTFTAVPLRGAGNEMRTRARLLPSSQSGGTLPPYGPLLSAFDPGPINAANDGLRYETPIEGEVRRLLMAGPSSVNSSVSRLRVVNPLIDVAENRRGRFLTGAPTARPNAGLFRGHAFSSIFRSGAPITPSVSSLSSILKPCTTTKHLRRKALGPIVSDRRWGTDMNDIETVGARASVVAAAFESYIESDIVCKKEDARTSDYETRPLSGGARRRLKSGSSDGQLIIPCGSNPGAPITNEGGESKEEGLLQETKEECDSMSNDDDSDCSDNREVYEGGADGSNDADDESPRDGNGEEEEHNTDMSHFLDSNGLQLMNTSHCATNIGGASADAGGILESLPSARIDDSSLFRQSAVQEPSGEPMTEIDLGNMAFIESLPDDLRAEVLANSEEGFLASLSSQYREEAAALTRRARESAIAHIVSAPSSIVVSEAQCLRTDNFVDSGSEIVNEKEAATVAMLLYRTTVSEKILSSLRSNEATTTEQLTLSDARSGELARAAADVLMDLSNFSITMGADQQLMSMMQVAVADQKNSMDMPFDSVFLIRLIHCLLLQSNTVDVPKPLLRLLYGVTRYERARVSVVHILLSIMNADTDHLLQYLPDLGTEQSKKIVVVGGFSEEQIELEKLKSLVRSGALHQVLFRRIISIFSYLLRKSDKSVWLSIMMPVDSTAKKSAGRKVPPTTPSVATKISTENAPSAPIGTSGDAIMRSSSAFDQLITVFQHGENRTGVQLVYLVQLLEYLFLPFSKLSISQVSQLIRTTKSISEHAAQYGSPGDVFDVVDKYLSSEAKLESEVGLFPDSSHLSAFVNLKHPYFIPFPLLNNVTASVLAEIVGCAECSGDTRKGLLRPLRIMALHDGNWMLLLAHLTKMCDDLAAKALIDFTNLHNALVQLMQNNGNAASAMLLPQLSVPKAIFELRLLSIFKQMSLLRSRSANEANEKELAVLSSFFLKMNIGLLWDALCECLDVVRELEGIVDFPETCNEGVSGLTSSSSLKGSAIADAPKVQKKAMLSSLTMRFMPLIECFLMFSSYTVIDRSTTTLAAIPDVMNDPHLSNSIGSSKKRKFVEGTGELQDIAAPSCDASSSSRTASLSDQQLAPSSLLFLGGSPRPLATAGALALQRTSSMLPGWKYRQHAEYHQMQLDVADNKASRQLAKFAEQNRILLNMLLKNNVQLLENSFSPLVNVPKCRQLLDFDVKRAFFKMRMKRKRQQASRSSNVGQQALRITVNRRRVFEESFVALKYKTSDEMKKKLSVTFHGEDGMDAGGLSREWYNLLMILYCYYVECIFFLSITLLMKFK